LSLIILTHDPFHFQSSSNCCLRLIYTIMEVI
jgi:hypothetical protein